MIVTKIEKTDKSKCRIYLNDEYVFWLYQKELDQYQLTEGTELSDSLYQELMSEVVLGHAKEKALSILKFMDRTEFELRRKLSEADFSEEIIDQAIDYTVTYGYLNDERFASFYVKSRMNKKSKLVIKSELLQKGVNSEDMERVLEELYTEDMEEDSEIIAIRKAVNKKTRNPETLDYEAKQKLIASLYRKGFEINKIKQVLG